MSLDRDSRLSCVRTDSSLAVTGAPLPSLWALGADFAAAVAAAEALDPPADVARELDALRHQALYGDVNIARPGLIAAFATSISGAEWCAVCAAAMPWFVLTDAVPAAIRDGWNALRGVSRAEAMERYIARVQAAQ